jgi:hypothetical protein
MRAKREYRDRERTQVAVLDALANRREEGMTVFELRSRVEVGIDDLEDALAELKADDLIEVENEDDRSVIVPEEHAIGPHDPETDETVFDRIREWLAR